MASRPLSTETMRSVYADFRCDTSTMTRVEFPGADGLVWRLLVATPTVAAWEAFTRVMARHEVLFLESAGGTYSCRFIGGTTKWSPHAFGIAIDLNPSQNPQQFPLTTVLTTSFTDAVKALVTTSGRQVFQWGGDWTSPTKPDPMHFQIGATPDELATGVIDPMEEDMPLNDDDLDRIRSIVKDEIAMNNLAIRDSLAKNNAAIRTALTEPRDASPIGKAVFNYMRGFTPDNVAKTLRRIDRNTQPRTPPRRRRVVRDQDETFTGGPPETGEGEPDRPTRRRSSGRTPGDASPPPVR